MTTHRSSELGDESEDRSTAQHPLESLDDITRDIADHRLRGEFSESLPDGKVEILREIPDRIEEPDAFSKAAKDAGIKDAEGVLGWSTDLESPAHVLKGDVPKEVATLIHEDLHRLTHPETMREMTADPALRDLYEGITEYLTEHAVEGLHGHKSGECYPEQVSQAGKLASEVGEPVLQKFFFGHEMNDEIEKAIETIAHHPG